MQTQWQHSSAAIRRRRVILGAALFTSVLFHSGCLFDSHSDDAQGGAEAADFATVRLALKIEDSLPKPIAKAMAGETGQRVRLRVSGPDMAPFEQEFSASESAFQLQRIPPGPARLFEVEILDAADRRLYSGSNSLVLQPGRTETVSITCLPAFSWVRSDFVLPMEARSQVATGRAALKTPLDTLQAPVEITSGKGRFLLHPIFHRGACSLFVQLFDSKGELVYRSAAAFIADPGQGTQMELEFEAAFSMPALSMEMVQPQGATVTMRFTSGRRPARELREVILTEIYPAPSAEDSSTEGEWFELFNRSQDTLDLEGCALTRGGGSGNAERLEFDASHFIPPVGAVAFGRRAASGVEFRYEDFNMVNSRDTLRLMCPGEPLPLDEVIYSSRALDSAQVTIRQGFVSSLDGDRIEERADSGSWCHTLNRPTSLEAKAASPGSVPGGCSAAENSG